LGESATHRLCRSYGFGAAGEILATTKEIKATSSGIIKTMVAAKVHRRQADKIYIFHHHMLKEIAKM